MQAGDEIIKLVLGARADDRSPRSTRCSTCPGTRARSCSERSGSPPSAPAGRPRSELCSNEEPGSGNAGLAPTSPPPAWPGFRQLTVTAITRESDSAISIRLEDPTGAPLPAARPGQYLTLRVQPDKQQRAVLRNYSLSGPPGAGYYRVTVKRERRRRRQRLSAHPARRRRPTRRCRTARHVHPRSRRMRRCC